jgi:hypothetical protein
MQIICCFLQQIIVKKIIIPEKLMLHIFFAVILCCPCICIDKCGGCRETNYTSSNRVNNVGYGIAIGMALRQ